MSGILVGVTSMFVYEETFSLAAMAWCVVRDSGLVAAHVWLLRNYGGASNPCVVDSNGTVNIVPWLILDVTTTCLRL
eukprot:jgi/Hompol1/1701/HPOL_005699-RA